LAAVAARPAQAADAIEQAQLAELDRVRAEVAGEVQLAAYDLVDELVYGWTQKPVFPTPTPVILAAVTVPVGLGTGMRALLENHIGDVLAKNPTANMVLVHCPSCNAVMVHSGPKGTVVSRGIDDPELLAKVGGSGGRHALFVDVEAEGTWLVLRARITELTPDLPIVWGRTLSTSASTPALLRQPGELKSAEDARQEYLDALHDRGPLTVPIRFTVRSYARRSGGGLGAPPFVWLQGGIEMSLTQARAWTGSVLLGYSNIPEAYQGLMAQARISRLVTGQTRSLTGPDLYFFVGGAVMTVWGAAATAFRGSPLTADEVLTDLNSNQDPRETFGTLHFGLELRIGNRIGTSLFLETIPSLRDSQNLGQYLTITSVRFQAIGTEVTFCF
jgi:hypothetical protein